MGIRPDAPTRTIETRSALTAATPWAELKDLPVFDGVVDVRHDGRLRTSLVVRSRGTVVWKAVFDGTWDEIEVDGAKRKATHGADEAGRPISWTTIEIAAGRTAVAGVGT
jgi:hypothetical protein